jgi:AraC-like DNA-binding protein
MNCFRKHISLLFVLFALFAGCDCAVRPVGADAAHDVLDLSGQWKIVPGDSPVLRLPDYDDSRAASIEIPGKWDRFLRQNRDLTATVWLRKKVRIDSSLRDRQMVLSLGPVSIADETYFNGVFVGGTGRIPSPDNPLAYDFTWHFDRNYTVNSSLVNYDDDNVIAMRVFSHYFNGIKDPPMLYTLEGWKHRYWLNNYMPSMNNFSPLILSMVIVLMLVVAAMGKVSTRVFVYTALFVSGVFVISFLLLGIPPLPRGRVRFTLFFSIYTISALCLLLAMREFFSVRSRLPMIVVMAAFVFVNILIIAAPTTAFLLKYAMIATLIFLVLCVSYVSAIFIQAVVRDPRRYWFISPFALLVLVSAAETYYLVVTDQMYRMTFVFVLRLVALGIAALFYFLFDFKKIEKERDSLARALLKKSKELRLAMQQLPRTRRRQDPRDIIHRVVEHIDAHFTETYDRAALAEKFGLNDDYMGQLFKKVTGTNIANYINCRRIEAARQLLEETDSKVIDIAFHVGFDNLTYFYRHFKKKTGYNPTDYRKMKRDGFVDLDFKSEADYY